MRTATDHRMRTVLAIAALSLMVVAGLLICYAGLRPGLDRPTPGSYVHSRDFKVVFPVGPVRGGMRSM